MTTNSIPYTLTNESITLVTPTGPRTIYKGTPQYGGLREALFAEQWDRIEQLLTVGGSIANWLSKHASVATAAFSVTDAGVIQHAGLDVPSSIANRMKAMATAGEDPIPLLRFYERLSKNPSYRSVEQLFPFMQHMGIPIESDGTFLAYKGVTNDLLDVHSKTFLNAPGQVHEMPRNRISDDPDKACHYGFHVGALRYATSFGPRTVICRVDPEHVVCIPHDESQQKMRVCKYAVIGFWNGQEMSSTISNVREEIADEDGLDDNEPYDGDAGSEYSQPDHIEPKADKPISVKPLKTSNRLARMTPAKLMEESIDTLRKYAAHTLKIVGASKMPGGKTALVSAVLKARRKVKAPAKKPAKKK